jgi:hypothetical protein
MTSLDSGPIEVGPGQALCIPGGAVCHFNNFGSVDPKRLCVITPSEGSLRRPLNGTAVLGRAVVVGVVLKPQVQWLWRFLRPSSTLFQVCL